MKVHPEQEPPEVAYFTPRGRYVGPILVECSRCGLLRNIAPACGRCNSSKQHQAARSWIACRLADMDAERGTVAPEPVPNTLWSRLTGAAA